LKKGRRGKNWEEGVVTLLKTRTFLSRRGKESLEGRGENMYDRGPAILEQLK